MLYLVLISLFLPFLSFLILSSNWIKKSLVPLIGCAAVLIPFALFTFAVYNRTDHLSLLIAPWISLNEMKADFLLHVDHLSLLMCLIITGVGFLIHVYSIGYMDHEKNLARFFAYLNFFIFSMLLLVLAGDLLLLFVGWECVGLASYLLIGFWYEKPSAANAATKAFIVNRIGDFGFILGILLTFFLFKTTNIAEVIANAASFGQHHPMIIALTLLLFCGAIAKSAQIPLHVWLPDAMEGPTPVSALIHAATMVTAGVYLIVRLHPIYLQAEETMQIIGIIGGITALFASLAAINQTDLKRVLAYSTISQLGLMFLACGVGAFYAAMFHLTTHAFMKALLFLSAGNVIHMMNGETEMDKMGGLKKELPKTNLLFLIGVLALSGIPPFAAFFSKDLILETEYLTGHTILFILACLASILTAFYMTRSYFLTFQGKNEHPEVKEAPAVMILPVSILAFLSAIGGFLGFIGTNRPILEDYLKDLAITKEEAHFSLDLWTSLDTWLAAGMSFFGVGLGVILYTWLKDKLPNGLPLLKRAFYIDTLYQKLFVEPYGAIAGLVAHQIEPKFFDQSLDASAQSTLRTAEIFQKMQSGQIRSYAAWMVIGAIGLLLYFAF